MTRNLSICLGSLCLLLAACGQPPGNSDGGVDAATNVDGGTDAGQVFLASCTGPTGGSFGDSCSYTWFCTGGERMVSCTRNVNGGDECTCYVAMDAGTTFAAPVCGNSSEADFEERVGTSCGW